MHAKKANFKVKMMARALEVSRSGYYSWKRRQLIVSTDPFAQLKTLIVNHWESSKKRSGARRILKDLIADGVDVTLYRVQKCMRELGISGIQPRAKKRTTIQSDDADTRQDLIKRDFSAAVPSTKLVGDITYLRTKEGWLYLAIVIDLCTRAVVGWSIKTHMKTSLIISALKMAQRKGYVALGAIFHSDRGSQYTSKAYYDYAASIGVRLSVGRTGTCHDNAVAESFFSMLKNEMYYTKTFETHTEARSAVLEYIEIYYNRKRRHSTIDYKMPQDVLDEFFDRTKDTSGDENIKLDFVA